MYCVNVPSYTLQTVSTSSMGHLYGPLATVDQYVSPVGQWNRLELSVAGVGLTLNSSGVAADLLRYCSAS